MQTLLIIVIVISILLILCYFLSRKWQLIQGYETVKGEYNKVATDIYTTLNNMDVEWWPNEGTLIGILRYGKNFDILPDFGPIGTDSDVDVMVRADTDKDWANLIDKLKVNLGNKYTFKYHHVIPKGLATFSSSKVILGSKIAEIQVIHIDVWRYSVDENKNLLSTDYAPGLLSSWNGTMNWIPNIRDDQGRMKKCKFEDLTLPCPNNYIELLEKWNAGKYTGNRLKFPCGGMWIKYGDFKCHECMKCKTVHSLTEKDIDYLEKTWKNLHDNGFASFHTI